MNSKKPETADTEAGTKHAEDDVRSDPAKGADDRVDWTDEGGATPSGPADTGDQTQ